MIESVRLMVVDLVKCLVVMKDMMVRKLAVTLELLDSSTVGLLVDLRVVELEYLGVLMAEHLAQEMVLTMV